MNATAVLIAIDLMAAVILSFALYYRRHRRRDLVVAFLGVNVGVLAVTTVLGSTEVALGLGLGLFGVLSIIRLRSSEISQREVAYYFAALAIGLVAGLPATEPWIPAALIALILVVMWVADHPALLSRARHQTINLDRAIADETELRAELSRRLGAEITSLSVQRLDLVDDTTLVDVRYALPRGAGRATAGAVARAASLSARHPAEPPAPTPGDDSTVWGAAAPALGTAAPGLGAAAPVLGAAAPGRGTAAPGLGAAAPAFDSGAVR